jgi:Tol biopolymer transport system component
VKVVRRTAALAALVTLCSAYSAETRDVPGARGVAYVRYLGGGRSDIWFAPLDGGRKQLIERRASHPLLSPDGRWIAFAKCTAADYCSDVYLVSTGRAKRRLLVRGVEADAWAPDSKRLFGTRPLSGFDRHGLVRIDVRDGRVKHLVDRDVERFSVSPSGQQVCVTLWRAGSPDLYVVGADGGAARRLTYGGVSDSPVWTTHGIALRRMVRHGTFPHQAWGADEIWRIDPDGHGSRRLARPPARILASGITGLAPIAWSVDGQRLVAALTNEFGGPPYAVNARTGAVRRIGSYSYSARSFGLSRDGRRVLVEDRKYDRLDRSQRIEIAPYAGGPPQVVARFAGSPTWNG